MIRWRLAGEGRGAQLRSLAELRSAVEPVAAELAAVNAPQELRQELLDVALAMRDAGKAGDVPRFLELDIQFHSLLLSGSGNEMFANLVGQVAETLTGRTVHGLMPDRPRGPHAAVAPRCGRSHLGRRRIGGPRGVEQDHAPHHLGNGARLGGAAEGVSFRCSGGRSPPSPLVGSAC